MIIQNNKTISALYKGTKEIVKRYKGTQVIYEAWKELIKSGVPPITLLKCKPTNFSTGLPSPYQQVEYLEATGTQFIDMKYTYKVNDILDIDFMKTNNTNTIQGIFGNGNTQLYVGVSLYVNNANLLTTTIGGILGENFARYSTPIENNLKYNVKIKGGTVYLNDEEIITVPNILFDGTQEDFSLFRRWGTNTMIGRIYKFSISRNDKKIFELIPCYRKSDNVLGMYDVVNDVFYTNAGTGEFLKGKDVATNLVDYKIYGDSKQQSKNLIPFPYYYTARTINGVTFTVNEDGSITLNGTASADNTNFLITYTSGFQLDTGNYVISGAPEGATRDNGVYMVWQNKAFVEDGKAQKITMTEKGNVYIYIAVKKGAVCDNLTFKPQIELGSVATDYVSPMPTPKTPVEVESVGDRTKNLFNNDINSIKQVTYYGTSGTEYKRYGYELYLPVGTYTINAISKVPSTNTTLYYMYGNVVDENNNVVGKSVNCVVNSIVYPKTFTIEEGEKLLIYDGITGGLTQAKQLFSLFDVQLEEGSTTTDYEPYGYKITVKVSGENIEPITTNIYLKEPLRKIGDYADYIDFEKNKVFRNIKTKIFDGTETFYVISSPGYEQYTYYILSIKNNVVNDACLSSYFVLQTNFSYTIKGDNKFRIYYSSTNSQSRIGFRVVENGEIITDVTTLKAKFAEAYKSGKPCTFYYAVPKDYETTEDITLPNIPLNKGTNIIEVATNMLPSNMEVKYIGKE